MKFVFVDAHSNGVRNLPTPRQLEKVKKGSSVKINHRGERFWVTVTKVDAEKNKLVGFVDNQLIDKHPFNYKSKVTFGFQNIYQILK